MDYDKARENDLELIRKDFPVTKKNIYMNFGPFAPTPLSTIKSVIYFLIRCSQEGPDSSSVHEYITSLMNDLRKILSNFINCKP